MNGIIFAKIFSERILVGGKNSSMSLALPAGAMMEAEKPAKNSAKLRTEKSETVEEAENQVALSSIVNRES